MNRIVAGQIVAHRRHASVTVAKSPMHSRANSTPACSDPEETGAGIVTVAPPLRTVHDSV